MKESPAIPESLFDKAMRAKLPKWVQTTIALAQALTPLIQVLVPLLLARLLADLLLKLLGLL
jgi:hypothetical protein